MAIHDEFNVFILGRRLFHQQWFVDNYVKIEKVRINYWRNHQKEIIKKKHTETYQGLKDYIQTIINNLNGRIGKMIIFSSIFIKSAKYVTKLSRCNDNC